ncbi:BTAD domain-containing putative transcriptional regulator [Streptomyces sp. NPDC048659]|uniref:AfsR/SARP family transcriptional regulator n=1 Tax=Streptomyces sp. NPDC048659 TaxID=3155489 RepID=UPI0034300023
MGLEFAILGPPRAWHDGHERPLGRPQQRALLCALLLTPGELVPVQRLITALWDEDEEGWPKDPVGQIGTHAHRLRRALDAPRALLGSSGGYRLAVAREAVDVFRYEDEAARAAALLRGDPARAGELALTALRRWRGEPLDGVPGPLARRTRDRLAASRRAVGLTRFTAELALGRHAEALPALRALAAAHPEDEEAHRLCLLALYRCGLRAEALALFAALRARLDARLGIDPGGAVTALHGRILRDDRSLAVPQGPHGSQGPHRSQGSPGSPGPTGPTGPPRRPPRPFQLPPDIPDLVGRRAQVREAERLLRAGADAGSPVVALSGAYGSGTSTLAVHLAHRVRDAFPDGQLYARGDAPGGVREVMAGFLRSLGERPPEDACAGALGARYRAALAGRRVLVLLDGAPEPGALLPGVAGCAALVTETGGELAAEVARLRIGPLEPEDAYELLARIAGQDRIHREPGAARELAALCGHVPARLRSAAARLAARPQWSVADLVGRLSA